MGDEKPIQMSLQARFGKIVHNTTRTSAEGAQQVKKGRNAGLGPAKSIKLVNNAAELYEVGKEVMPSTHSYMKVNFATRKADGLQCVIKTRFKPNCFRTREDERSWRHNTEFLLNTPDHLAVARLYEVLEDSKAFYVVMEKVSGMDLFEFLEQEGKPSVDHAKDVMRQLLTGIAHLHSNNAVHKDLKLENVMVNTGARDAVKVIDFDTVEEWTPSSPLAKDVVGTDQYISQEAYAGQYSPLSDIFATGVIGYRLLSGKFPFHDGMFDDEAGENWVGSPKMAQIRRRLKVAKVDFSHSTFRDNPGLCGLVQSMLAYNENVRPSAAAALEQPCLQDDAKKGRPSFLLGRPGEELIDDGIVICE
mmetsp:Transcript_64954/g.190560  ORF Transcript_64954/g.190560 Transcript_64954/m.190560 type:complete len:361 (-) Transcript_64954:23-1105(-)